MTMTCADTDSDLERVMQQTRLTLVPALAEEGWRWDEAPPSEVAWPVLRAAAELSEADLRRLLAGLRRVGSW